MAAHNNTNTLLIFLIVIVTIDLALAIMQEFRDFSKTVQSVLDDLTDGLNQLSNGLKSVEGVIDAAGEEKCEFKCKNRAKPRKNVNHYPSSNGCGTYGISVNVDHVPQFVNCCNNHDICYDTCNNDKDDCDHFFQKCLYQVCRNHHDAEFIKNCKFSAKLMYSGTVALGCHSYLESQKNACTCIAKGRGGGEL